MSDIEIFWTSMDRSKPEGKFIIKEEALVKLARKYAEDFVSDDPKKR